MALPLVSVLYAEGVAELHRGRCLCPPDAPHVLAEAMAGAGRQHACVTMGRLWLRRADGSWWVPRVQSAHIAGRWLALVRATDSWADVAAVLEVLPVGEA